VESIYVSSGTECDADAADMQKLVGGIPDGVDGLSTSHDHDRDKYKRRPALQWFTRWFRYIVVPGS